MELDQGGFEKSMFRLLSGNVALILRPKGLSMDDLKIEKNGKIFYLLPAGRVDVEPILRLGLKVNLHDIHCVQAVLEGLER
jgi:hypothetical protein